MKTVDYLFETAADDVGRVHQPPPHPWQAVMGWTLRNADHLRTVLCLGSAAAALLLLWTLTRPDLVCDLRSAMPWMQCR